MGNKSEFPALLSPGLHTMSLEELGERCVQPFPLSTTRSVIMQGIKHVVDRMKNLSIPGSLYIDGSFLTQKIDPKDVDFVLISSSDLIENATPAQDEFIREIAEKKFLYDHLCDSYLTWYIPEGSANPDLYVKSRQYWLEWFGHDRNKEPKGIAVIEAHKE